MQTKLYHTTNTDNFNQILSHCTWTAFIHDGSLALDILTILKYLSITPSNILFHYVLEISLSKENFNLYIINQLNFMYVETPHVKFV